ncbi:LysR substrate-binding domain-containing protein [Xenophilus sp. Marseille-Q4582]|uniref:LysR substrate-binding domain-containing protein n=1 Tax=Xenophilus sp. Marseille-Q4582 TaxID=2866600 RepID=UPI001CE46486|nr:LysR substrate-binding domain-containing protein [Xenophilus sp. Marseille-Q4582]
MDLRQLRYFVAVADTLSFRRASEQLHIAQPALSRQIQQFEQQLGARLFERDKRSVSLTAAGLAVLEHAKGLLSQVHGLPAIAQRAAQGQSGRLRIGFISLVAYEYLPALVRAFRAHLPQVDVRMHEFPVMEQYAPLLEDRFDVLILRPLVPDPLIALQVIDHARFVVALPAHHPLCSRAQLRVGDLANEEFISLPRAAHGPSFQAQILGFCRAAGFCPSVLREVGDSQAMMGMVGAGMGVAIVPEPVRHLRTAGVEYRRLSDLTQRADIALAWRSDSSNPLIEPFSVAATQAFPGPARAPSRQPALCA